MQQIVQIEPLKLPDLRRPEQMPSLPAWVASRADALAENLQINPETGSFHDALTLPQSLLLTPRQRAEIESHVASLRSSLNQTPENSQDAEAETLVLVTKMLLVLPSQRTSEAGAEAKGEAYMDALDDVPSWAVRAGIRNWYRASCGSDERGKPYDYAWMPPPPVLRRISMVAIAPTILRIMQLDRLLSAVPFVDCAAELARGRAAWAGLGVAMTDKMDIRSLTFDQAVELGAAKVDKSA